jgi:hypothetical protein
MNDVEIEAYQLRLRSNTSERITPAGKTYHPSPEMLELEAATK